MCEERGGSEEEARRKLGGSEEKSTRRIRGSGAGRKEGSKVRTSAVEEWDVGREKLDDQSERDCELDWR